MDILKPFKGLETRDVHKEFRELNEKIEEMKKEKHEKMSEYFLSCYNNFKFTTNQIKRYERDIYEFIGDIVMINNIKQSYERNKNYCFLEIAYEEYDESSNYYSFNISYTPEFAEIEDEISQLYDEYSGDNCFSDMTNFCLLLPGSRYYDLFDCDIEYTEDYHCKDEYRMRTVYYKVIEAHEKLIIKNKDKLIKLVKEEYQKS